jgi:hypothetical protein
MCGASSLFVKVVYATAVYVRIDSVIQYVNLIEFSGPENLLISTPWRESSFSARTLRTQHVIFGPSKV